jgi:hypothetical protein
MSFTESPENGPGIARDSVVIDSYLAGNPG